MTSHRHLVSLCIPVLTCGSLPCSVKGLSKAWDSGETVCCMHPFIATCSISSACCARAHGTYIQLVLADVLLSHVQLLDEVAVELLGVAGVLHPLQGCCKVGHARSLQSYPRRPVSLLPDFQAKERFSMFRRPYDRVFTGSLIILSLLC